MDNLKGWKFPIQVDEATGKIKTIENNDNVRQAINIILSTQRQERKIVFNFGTNLRAFMFEIVNPEFISTLKETISSSLRRWESHILDLNVSVKASMERLSIWSVTGNATACRQKNGTGQR